MTVFFGRSEKRAMTWDDWFAGTGGKSGVTFAGGIDPALSVIPVYAAVSYIADMFAVLPLGVFTKGGGSSARVETPGYLETPDSNISPMDWRYQLAVSLKLRGNAYGIVGRTPMGTPLGVTWVHPDKVRVAETGGIPEYWLQGATRAETLWQHGGKIIHIREFVQPGTVIGLSPIAQFRQVYETAAAAIGYGRDWFENAAIPSGILTNEKGTLKPGQAREAKDLFAAATKKREPVVLDLNWKWTQVSIAPEEAQFLATIKATATQIAAIFRVSPEDIGGEAGNSRTYSNREMDQEVFNVRTLLPLCTRVELALKVLLPVGQFIKFNMDVLNRPNLLDRSRANTENLRNGSVTLAEVRAREDMPALTPEQIEQWQSWYSTQKTVAESVAESVSTSITKES